MATNELRFARMFQLWEFTVGHKQLLLRSTKDDRFRTRVDVYFKNVAVVNLPTICHGLTISEADGAQQQDLLSQVSQTGLSAGKVFLIRGDRFTGYVIAGFMDWHEDELEYDDPSKFVLHPADFKGLTPPARA